MSLKIEIFFHRPHQAKFNKSGGFNFKILYFRDEILNGNLCEFSLNNLSNTFQNKNIFESADKKFYLFGVEHSKRATNFSIPLIF